MVKSVITGSHPDTNEAVYHKLEADAICTVSVKESNEKLAVEVNNSIMGRMNVRLTESMIEGLIGACYEILEGLNNPLVAALILSKALNKHSGQEEEADGVAGESSEPERPSEQ